MSAEEISCPKCSSTQITASKKGFSGTKAVGGALLTGGIGLLAGTIGSNKIKITCLQCGHTWKPGDIQKEEKKVSTMDPDGNSLGGCLILIVVVMLIAFLINTC